MRKDAKIGFAIGGVLLAVLTVYAVVVPRHKHSTIGGVTLTAGTTPAPAVVAVPDVTATIDPPVAPPVADRTEPVEKRVTTVAPAAVAEPAVAVATTNTPTVPAAPETKAQDTFAKSDAGRADTTNWEKLLGGNPDAPALMTTSTPTEESTTVPASGAGAAAGGGVNTPGSTTANDPFANSTTSVNTTTAMQPTSVSLVKSTTQPAVAGKAYTIKTGQTLSAIAAEVYGNQRFYVAIMRANPSVNPTRLHAGMKIILPDITDVKPEPTVARRSTDDAPTAMAVRETKTVKLDSKSYKVESGDNLYKIAKKLYGTGRQADAIYALNEDSIGPDKSRLKLGMILKLPKAATVPASDAIVSN